MKRLTRRETLTVIALAALLLNVTSYVMDCRHGHAEAAATHAQAQADSAQAERDVVEGALYICGVVEDCDLTAQTTFTNCSGLPYLRRETRFRYQWDAEGLITAQQDAHGNDYVP